MTASLFALMSRRLQPVAVALLVLALCRLATAVDTPSQPATSVRAALPTAWAASAPQIAPERS